MTIYVGNLSYNTTEGDLRELFCVHGNIKSISLPMDHETQRIKGFGFVEFATVEDAIKAKEAMDGKELDGREIKVDFAEDKREA